jgi:hypothetical protein
MKNELKRDLEKAKQTHSPPQQDPDTVAKIKAREKLYLEILESDIYPKYKRLRDEQRHGEAEALLRGKNEEWRVCCNNCYTYHKLIEGPKPTQPMMWEGIEYHGPWDVVRNRPYKK